MRKNDVERSGRTETQVPKTRIIMPSSEMGKTWVRDVVSRGVIRDAVRELGGGREGCCVETLAFCLTFQG